MKTLTILAALMLGTAAHAGPFGLPDHEPDGYRDTGCDPAQQVQITNDAGEYLYSNNSSCPSVGGSASGFSNLLAIGLLPERETPDDNGDDSEDPVDPEDPIDCKDCEIATK